MSFFIILTFLSCQSNPNNFIIVEDQNPRSTIGFDNATIVINQSQKSEITDLEKYSANGLILDFDSKDILKAVTINSTNYKTNTGIGIGSDRDEVLAHYGKPLKDGTPLMKSKTQIGIIKGLIYRNGIFLLNEEGKIRSITLTTIG